MAQREKKIVNKKTFEVKILPELKRAIGRAKRVSWKLLHFI